MTTLQNRVHALKKIMNDFSVVTVRSCQPDFHGADVAAAFQYCASGASTCASMVASLVVFSDSAIAISIVTVSAHGTIVPVYPLIIKAKKESSRRPPLLFECLFECLAILWGLCIVSKRTSAEGAGQWLKTKKQNIGWQHP